MVVAKLTTCHARCHGRPQSVDVAPPLTVYAACDRGVFRERLRPRVQQEGVADQGVQGEPQTLRLYDERAGADEDDGDGKKKKKKKKK